MEMNLIDTAALCRNCDISLRQFDYLRKKHPDLLVPVARVGNNCALWDPGTASVVLRLRSTLFLKTWATRRKLAKAAASETQAPGA